MDWHWRDRTAPTFLTVAILIATAVGYFKGEHAMLVVLSIGMIAFLYAAFEDLQSELEKLRDELRSLKQ